MNLLQWDEEADGPPLTADEWEAMRLAKRDVCLEAAMEMNMTDITDMKKVGR